MNADAAPTRGPRPGHRDGWSDKRRQVFDAAIQVFSARGYRAASMREVGEAAALSKSTLYHYFSSKEALLSQLYARVIAESTALIQEIIDRGFDPAITLREVLIQRVEYTCEHQPMLRIFFEEELELPPGVTEQLSQERQAYEQVVLSLVERGIAEGYLRSAVSAKITANTLLGAVNWTYRWYSAQGELSPRELGERVADLLLAGVLASGVLEQPPQPG